MEFYKIVHEMTNLKLQLKGSTREPGQPRRFAAINIAGTAIAAYLPCELVVRSSRNGGSLAHPIAQTWRGHWITSPLGDSDRFIFGLGFERSRLIPSIIKQMK